MINVLDFVGKTTNDKGQVTVNAHQHKRAVQDWKTNEHGEALMKMLLGWELYRDAHLHQFESPVGEDGVIGTYWAEVGLAIKRLLDGETGGLDCGSISHNITSIIESQGFKTDGYKLT